ncbi:LiaI-LiaF-like domain-containing protein [Tellurirhabdus rosea]|uniref:LiaI-LiaF-like domain-containing protein n=1 Tax=Tellurirhabdus rosea TaxID=2674997 RepID=UPI0022545998|nr:DUF5668 domain-containing protein [Tellurirhabdus rosea]
MKSRSIVPGIVLITLGVIFLGEKLDWFHLDLGNLARFWPILLILAGVNIILRRSNSSAAVVTTVLLAVAIPLAVISAFRSNREKVEVHVDDDEDDFEWHSDDSDNDTASSGTTPRTDRFAEPMAPDIQQARLKFGGGAGTFTIGAPSDSLVVADTRMTVSSYSMSVSRDDEDHTAEVNLELNDDKFKIRNGKIENRVNLKLNAQPAWEFDLGFGAGKADLDLSAYAVRRLELDAGAAEIDLKLGDRAAESLIDIESGVASVTIRVPKTVGCQIEMQGAMNSQKFVGFTEVSNNRFQSPDYDKAAKKVTIKYEGGMSSVKVERY